MTPKHKALKGHMDKNGIYHLSPSEQKAKIKDWPKATRHVSKDEIHKEYSSGDTFEGQARLNKRK